MMEVGLQADCLDWVTLCPKRKAESQIEEEKGDQSSLLAIVVLM